MASRNGFSIIELLIVMAMVSILSAIAVSNLPNLRRQIVLEEAAQAVSQSIQEARSRSLISPNCTSVSSCWRFRISNNNTFVLEEFDGAWKAKSTVTFPGVLKFVSTKTDDAITFNTRGMATFSTGLESGLQVTDGKTTLRILPSMSGATRITKL